MCPYIWPYEKFGQPRGPRKFWRRPWPHLASIQTLLFFSKFICQSLHVCIDCKEQAGVILWYLIKYTQAKSTGDLGLSSSLAKMRAEMCLFLFLLLFFSFFFCFSKKSCTLRKNFYLLTLHYKSTTTQIRLRSMYCNRNWPTNSHYFMTLHSSKFL